MEDKKYIVECESARFKGITGEFGRVAIPAFESGIERERNYLKRCYDCKTPIMATRLNYQGRENEKQHGKIL